MRYGTHCECPLVHRICADSEGEGVICVDAEVLSPPPAILQHSTVLPEQETLVGHETVKVRDKVRVFRLKLDPGESIEINYNFFHLFVSCSDGELEIVDRSTGCSYNRLLVVGDMDWRGPIAGNIVRNAGVDRFICFVIQWRNFLLV